MRNQTDLMRAILTNKTAQKIIDYVSPIYGNSYVGLWLFQAIGTALDEVYDLSAQLRYEANPATATLLLDLWEDHYKLTRAPELTVEQRRSRILTKLLTRGACTPEKLAAAVSSSLGDVEVEVTENTAKNTFTVRVLDSVTTLAPASAAIQRMKPAHLICEIHLGIPSTPTADVKTAVALTYAEKHYLNAEATQNWVFVDGETLYTNYSKINAEGESLVFNTDIAGADGETLTINT